jgi:hypothetical protein
MSPATLELAIGRLSKPGIFTTNTAASVKTTAQAAIAIDFMESRARRTWNNQQARCHNSGTGARNGIVVTLREESGR